ncbi:MAG: hypothetical protein DRI24_23685 [Deltaproteobacteria bacterium]|nr:MAG: hypothetical protein DRI24_23685 [Deltaproteobacteria bacterium]
MSVIAYLPYAGGFTLGMKRAGIETDMMFHDGYAEKTFAANFPDTKRVKIDFDWPKREGVKIMYGNPPCAAWSSIGKRQGAKDPRVADTRRWTKLVDFYQPKIMVTESVLQAEGFMDEWLIPRLNERGYATTKWLHNGLFYGLPQSRRRLFIIGHRVPFQPEEPDRTATVLTKNAFNGIDIISNPELNDLMTAPTIRKELDPFLSQIKPGEKLRRAYERLILIPQHGRDESNWPRNARGHVIGRPGFGALRLDPDRPAGSFPGIYPMVHPTEDRWLQINEVKIGLCQYGSEYVFTPRGNGDIAKEMARAVMPAMGEAMGRAILASRSLNRPFIVENKEYGHL